MKYIFVMAQEITVTEENMANELWVSIHVCIWVGYKGDILRFE